MAAQMVAEAAIGAVFGEVFGELLSTLLNARDKAVKFKSILKRLEFTLNSISPLINEIQSLNNELDAPIEETKELIEKIKEGTNLVRKCSKVRWWNYCKKPHYSNKLLELNDSLVHYLQTVLQVQQTRDDKKILVEVKQVNVKLDRLGKGAVSYHKGSIAGCCGVPDPPANTIGLDVPLKEVKMMLLKDGASVVVLTAPGGCGKTTLAKMLCKDDEIQGIYKDNIFFVTVSKTHNLRIIVQKIFQHKDYPVPEFQNDEDAINQLENLLKRIGPDPVLLVLDDVWSGSESLIQKFMFRIPEYKILVTSRFVFPRFDSTYSLKLLNDEDAMTLFRQLAFPQDRSSYVPDEDLVSKIVRSCTGFPLALNVVGGSLCGQPAVAWQSRVMQWSEGQSIFDSNSDLLVCLQSSLDALDKMPKLKECYLDLGSFPEDQRIPATALIDMWVELYEVHENGLGAMSNLYELSTRNLINLVLTRKDASEVDGFYNDHFVMQHDLLRELAIHHSSQEPIEQRKRLIMDISGNNLPKWWMEQKQQPIRARLLAITTDEVFSSTWYDMQLPEVEVLILNFRTSNYTLPQFMEKMGQLKVLIITNYGFSPAELSNFPAVGSLSNLKRIRLEQVSIPSICNSNLQLENLQKISLVMCEIGEAFRNCTIQISSMLPNLIEIDIDYCNDLVELPAGICDIVHLKKLSITNCNKLSSLPEGIGKLTNLEVLRVHACTELLELPESIGSLHNLCFLDISDCLSIGEMPRQMGELCGLRKLHMRGCSRLCKLPPSVMDLAQLKDVICDEETASLWEDFKIHLTNLKIEVPEEDINLNWLPNLHF